MAPRKNDNQMELFDAEKWSPTELVAPDGRKWTPTSLAEEKNLVSAYGYRPVGSGAKSDRKAGATPPSEGSNK